MKKEFIAYSGPEFTVEWYFDDRGKSNVLEYFESLSSDRQKKLFNLFRLIGDIGKIFNKEKFRSEGDQLYVFKPSPDRFFCFFYDGSKLIVTNAYEKKSAKMPVREKDRALRAKSDYTKRCKRGSYYD
jgi:hypothetical protein